MVLETAAAVAQEVEITCSLFLFATTSITSITDLSYHTIFICSNTLDLIFKGEGGKGDGEGQVGVGIGPSPVDIPHVESPPVAQTVSDSSSGGRASGSKWDVESDDEGD